MKLWAYSEPDYITGSAYRYWDRRKKGNLVAEGEAPNFRRIVSRIVHMRVEQLVPKALFLTVEQRPKIQGKAATAQLFNKLAQECLAESERLARLIDYLDLQPSLAERRAVPA